MGFWSRHVQPRLIAGGMRNPVMAAERPGVVGRARGVVLELGTGSGLNLPHYRPEQVERVFGLEPDAWLRDKTAAVAAEAPVPVELLAAGAESVPLPPASVDTVVSTWTLCSISDLPAALAEVRRVLRPGGRIVFLEHGRAPDPGVARWQDRLEPLFIGMAGCRPNRAFDRDLEAAGFRFDRLEMEYLQGPRFLSFHYRGEAVPAR
jgi:ubiquinone/menaquinone biosynthesis C-methylase UbiE